MLDDVLKGKLEQLNGRLETMRNLKIGFWNVTV